MDVVHIRCCNQRNSIWLEETAHIAQERDRTFKMFNDFHPTDEIEGSFPKVEL